MALPIFDGNGVTVGWLNNNEAVHDLDGTPITYIQGNAVYEYGDTQIGFSKDGYFRDGYGNAVAFMRGAHGGPMLPLTELPLLPPMLEMTPMRSLRDLPAMPPMPTFNWSHLTWDEFTG